MTTIHTTPPPGAPPFAIYEDPEDNETPSPSIAYDEGISFNSEQSLPGEDDALQSIEDEHEHEEDFGDEPAPYSSSFTSRPSTISAAASRRISGMTSTSFISSLPSELSISSKPAASVNYADDRYTPRKERPSLRNPSSVRAMQMTSPLPIAAFENSRDRLKGAYKLAAPSRSGRSETSVSASGSRRHRQSGYIEHSPQPTPASQHLPLVLLHVTIIPMQFPYSPELTAKFMPDWLVENYKLLEEKLQDIVLMRRGLLISHPREEYDVLEERILESLELKAPRLLKCGHFLGPDDSSEPEEDDDDVVSVVDDATGRGSRMSGGTLTVEEEGEWKYPNVEHHDRTVCTECHRHVKRPGKGVGKGARKWDLKIYAANGLMRAGAWSAAWSEMEKADVEISPWIPDDVRKYLDKKAVEQQERAKDKQLYEAEVLRRVEEEAARLKKLEDEAEQKRKAEEAERQRRMEEAVLQKKLEDAVAAEKRTLDHALNQRIEEAKESIRREFEIQALQEADSVAERFRALEEALKREQLRSPAQPPILPLEPTSFEDRTRSRSRGRPRSISRQPHQAEVPLSTLLSNYFLVLATDRRNLIIAAMGALVIFLSMQRVPISSSSLSSGHHDRPDLVPSIVVTTTATAIETSISTVTVTQVHHAESVEAYTVSPPAATLSPALENSIASDEAITPTALSLGPHETETILESALESVEVDILTSPEITDSMPVEETSFPSPSENNPPQFSESSFPPFMPTAAAANDASHDPPQANPEQGQDTVRDSAQAVPEQGQDIPVNPALPAHDQEL
ncbi:hypothetical protein K504DRAFT_457795 [Pleomassaria siparia CBS 279.74]|uniref:Pathway-specific nitrogen regulator n=1 Tax=Pleomassaria siparia CBS 279.74 TaxID=1314801 RepID=A0A6G1KTC5_9PLEO|nr:hypothetical protein K504DRAFT_457795 [Pleomassaria siparia CBS 279.74]